MAIRTDFTAGEVLAAADLNDTFAAKLDLAGGKILQVIEGTHATSVTTTSTSFVTSSLTATITPSSASNKVLVIARFTAQAPGAPNLCASALFRGTVAGTNITSDSGYVYSAAGLIYASVTLTKLDSPATTSAQVYTVGFRATGGTVGVHTDNTDGFITLMEVSA
jgi:hypothetical protein